MKQKEANMGQTDLQYKDMIRDWLAFLDRLLKLGVSEEAEKEILELKKRKEKALED